MTEQQTQSQNGPSLFEEAVRTRLRIDSSRGLLSAEMLWDVPLRSKDGFNLDEIAKGLAATLRSTYEESFVEPTKKDPVQVQRALALDVVKRVIHVKLSEENARKALSEKKKEKERLLEVLSAKEEDELKGLSKEEILKRINSLDA